MNLSFRLLYFFSTAEFPFGSVFNIHQTSQVFEMWHWHPSFLYCLQRGFFSLFEFAVQPLKCVKSDTCTSHRPLLCLLIPVCITLPFLIVCLLKLDILVPSELAVVYSSLFFFFDWQDRSGSLSLPLLMEEALGLLLRGRSDGERSVLQQDSPWPSPFWSPSVLGSISCQRIAQSFLTIHWTEFVLRSDPIKCEPFCRDGFWAQCLRSVLNLEGLF